MQEIFFTKLLHYTRTSHICFQGFSLLPGSKLLQPLSNRYRVGLSILTRDHLE